MYDFIDLSLTISPNDSEPVKPEIQYINHMEGATILGENYGISAHDFPGDMAISQEIITLTSHTGTHMDAPFHYGPICEGKQARRIEDIPLEWCFSKGIFIDVSNNKSSDDILKEEIIQYIYRNNISINPYDIVLIYTGADSLWNTKDYFLNYRGLSREALEWILEQGVKIVGIDTFSFDPPFHKMLTKYCQTKNKDTLWPAHLLGRSKEYLQIERLTNLHRLIGIGEFLVSCFPIKIDNAGASWVRAVAMVKKKNVLDNNLERSV